MNATSDHQQETEVPLPSGILRYNRYKSVRFSRHDDKILFFTKHDIDRTWK